jgi:hypothetical protein
VSFNGCAVDISTALKLLAYEPLAMYAQSSLAGGVAVALPYRTHKQVWIVCVPLPALLVLIAAPVGVDATVNVSAVKTVLM